MSDFSDKLAKGDADFGVKFVSILGIFVLDCIVVRNNLCDFVVDTIVEVFDDTFVEVVVGVVVGVEVVCFVVDDFVVVGVIIIVVIGFIVVDVVGVVVDAVVGVVVGVDVGVEVVCFVVDDFIVDDFVVVVVVVVVTDGFVVDTVVAVEVCDVVVDNFDVGWVVSITGSDVELKGHTLTQKSISVSECSSFPHSFRQLSTSLLHPSPQQTARFLSVFLVFPGQLSGHFVQSQASQLLNSHKFIVSCVALNTQGFSENPH